MQFTRDVSALFLLRGYQPPGQVFYPGVAIAQGLLTLAQRLLNPSAPGPLDQQREDQERLSDTQRGDANNPPFIKDPEGGFSEPDDAARGQPVFADSPASELTPIKYVYIRPYLGDRNPIGILPLQHPQRQSRCLL